MLIGAGMPVYVAVQAVDTRKSIDGLAHEGVARIAEFFHLDNNWRDLDPEERRQRRFTELSPKFYAFHQWMAAHSPTLLPRSPLAQAMGNAVNHCGAFTRFFDDGRLPLANDVAERTMRPIAVGRGNWLFAGSVRGGKAVAIVRSFVESAKLHGLNPFRYLRDVLTRLPSPHNANLDSLLPHLWQTACVSSSSFVRDRCRRPDGY